MTKSLLSAAIAALSLFAFQAHAAEGDCAAKAAEKKLAGAAKTSFMKKCEKDAAASAPMAASACDKTATEKKLHGAARTSFVKKCNADQAAPKK